VAAPDATTDVTPAPTPTVAESGGGPDHASEPTPTPTPTPTRTPVPVPGPRPAGIDEMAAQVAALRGLDFDGPVDARVISAADLGAKFAALAFDELIPGEVEADRRLLASLRLIDVDVDLLGIIDALFREQILGLYVPEERILYIGGDDVQLTDYQRVTAAHELVHALQDVAFDLTELLDAEEREADAALAIRALVEGDAVVSERIWSERHQSAAEQERSAAEALGRSSPTFAAAPAYLRDSIAFPYVEGTAFVATLHASGGFAAVDAAFAAPPRSTRHILHPLTYLDGEEPLDVRVTSTPGAGWDAGPVYTFGEFDLRHLLSTLGTNRANALAEGVGGGETRSWQRGEDDATALWLSFVSADDAAQVCAAAPEWYRITADGTDAAGGADGDVLQGDRDWFSWSCTERDVRMGFGPDAVTATSLVADGPAQR
jgi:hypothetical protein